MSVRSGCADVSLRLSESGMDCSFEVRVGDFHDCLNALDMFLKGPLRCTRGIWGHHLALDCLKGEGGLRRFEMCVIHDIGRVVRT